MIFRREKNNCLISGIHTAASYLEFFGTVSEHAAKQIPTKRRIFALFNMLDVINTV